MTPTESFYSKEERKINGVFYTPAFLSDYLAKKVLHYLGTEKIPNNVFDPACGDSILLKSFVTEFSNNSTKKLKVVGVDKDINAVTNSTFQFQSIKQKKSNAHFINTDSLFPVKGKSPADGWADIRNTLNCKNGFDVVLSNPPWGADLSLYNPLAIAGNFDLANGQFDIFDVFVEITLNNLKKNGLYALILPDSVFSQEQKSLRRLLATSTTINLIARLGEKIFPEINRACVVVIGRKELPALNHKVDCFHLSADLKKKIFSSELDLQEVEKELIHRVKQSRFYHNEDYIFDIGLKAEEQETFDKLQVNSIPLKNFVDSTRGVEISKKGVVYQCVNCSKWMPFPKSKSTRCSNCQAEIQIESAQKEQIIYNHNGAGNIKFKTGEDLFRFTSITKSWINILKDGINYKDLSIYNGTKILVRKTGVGITASIDYDNSVTTQVVYILKLKQSAPKPLTLEFILAVLNSRAMTYFLLKKFGETEWKSHPYLTQAMLINLPFPKIDLSSEEVVAVVDNITQIVKDEAGNVNSKNISKPNDIYIEKNIADFFGLTQDDYANIFKALNSAEPLIPIKRLLNTDTKEIFEVNGI
jgi:adenine-specific DNA-methyltransferase